MQNRVARHFEATTIALMEPGNSAYGNDLSVTISPTTITVPCSEPREYDADGSDADRVLSGSLFVLIDRSNAALTFDPQEGQTATIAGEEYRIEKVRYLPGSIRVHLKGAAAEGVGGS